MKHRIALLLCIGIGFSVRAQLTAGEVPDGQIAYDPGIDLELSMPNSVDSATVDIDCDDSFDMEVRLVRGQPELDAPNMAILRMIDDDLELCDGGQAPRYYIAGEQLGCTGAYSWQSDPEFVLGSWGGFFAIEPYSVDSSYLAFQRDGHVGWIQLSFDVESMETVYLRVHRVLSICGATGQEEPYTALPVLFPNPTIDGEAFIDPGPGGVRSVEVLDAVGRIVARYGTVRTIPAPRLPGSYLVRVTGADGRTTVLRWIRQ